MNVYKLGNDHLDDLAESTHEGWMESMQDRGYHHPRECPVKLNHPKYEDMTESVGGQLPNLANSRSCFYCNIDMVPYSELPESVRDTYAAQVLNMLDKIKTIVKEG